MFVLNILVLQSIYIFRHSIIDTIRENRSRRLARKTEGRGKGSKTDKKKVEEKRKKGKPKKWWLNIVIESDTKLQAGVSEKDTEDRIEWKLRTN